MAANDMENIREKAFMPLIVQLYITKSQQNTEMNKVIFSGQNKGCTLSENYKTLVLNSTSRIKLPLIWRERQSPPENQTTFYRLVDGQLNTDDMKGHQPIYKC